MKKQWLKMKQWWNCRTENVKVAYKQRDCGRSILKNREEKEKQWERERVCVCDR